MKAVHEALVTPALSTNSDVANFSAIPQPSLVNQSIILTDIKTIQDSAPTPKVQRESPPRLRESPPRSNDHSKLSARVYDDRDQPDLPVQIYREFVSKVIQMIFSQIVQCQLPSDKHNGEAWKNLTVLSNTANDINEEQFKNSIVSVIMFLGDFDSGRKAAIAANLNTVLFPSQYPNTNKWFNLITEEIMSFRKPIFDIINQCENRQKSDDTSDFTIGFYVFYKTKLIEQWNLNINTCKVKSMSKAEPNYLPKLYKYLVISIRTLYSFLVVGLPRYRFVKKLVKKTDDYPFLCRISARPNQSHACFDVEPTTHNIINTRGFPFTLSVRYAELETLQNFGNPLFKPLDKRAFMLPTTFEQYFAAEPKKRSIKKRNPIEHAHPLSIQTRNLSTTPPPASRKMATSTPPPPISHKKPSMPSPLTARRHISRTPLNHSRTSLGSFNSLSSGSQTSPQSGSKPPSAVPSNPSSLLCEEREALSTKANIEKNSNDKALAEFIETFEEAKGKLNFVNKSPKVLLSETLLRLEKVKLEFDIMNILPDDKFVQHADAEAAIAKKQKLQLESMQAQIEKEHKEHDEEIEANIMLLQKQKQELIELNAKKAQKVNCELVEIKIIKIPEFITTEIERLQKLQGELFKIRLERLQKLSTEFITAELERLQKIKADLISKNLTDPALTKKSATVLLSSAKPTTTAAATTATTATAKIPAENQGISNKEDTISLSDDDFHSSEEENDAHHIVSRKPHHETSDNNATYQL